MAAHESAAKITAVMLAVAIEVSDRTLITMIRDGEVPAPDARSIPGNGKRWTLPTIRRWRPDVADRIEHLLKMPPLKTAA